MFLRCLKMAVSSLLRHQAQCLPQCGQAKVPRVDGVDEHTATPGLKHAQEHLKVI